MPKQTQLEDNSLETLPGVGKVTKTKLHNLGINRITDLLLYLPNQLVDKTNISNINKIKNGEKCLFIGVIDRIFYTKGFQKKLDLINFDPVKEYTGQIYSQDNNFQTFKSW